MSRTVGDPVAVVVVLHLNDAGSIPTVNISIACLGMVNLFHAQIKLASSKHMQREIPLNQQASNLPTHPKVPPH